MKTKNFEKLFGIINGICSLAKMYKYKKAQ